MMIFKILFKQNSIKKKVEFSLHYNILIKQLRRALKIPTYIACLQIILKNQVDYPKLRKHIIQPFNIIKIMNKFITNQLTYKFSKIKLMNQLKIIINV